MLSFKRLLYILLAVGVLGGVFLTYHRNESQTASVPLRSLPAPEREFTETRHLEGGDKPTIWVLGDPGDERFGEIYSNVLQLCADLHLTAAGAERLDAKKAAKGDLVIVCDAAVSRRAAPGELEAFIGGGGRAILAAGLAAGDGDSVLWPVLGVRKKSSQEDFRELAFEKPLFPVQPERAIYDGESDSTRMEVCDGASVYIREAKENTPVLYTYDYREGGVCLINGTFLADERCIGLLTGAIGALLEDFVYPVLGVKAVFLDNFPMLTPEDDAFCMKAYGYSAEGFVLDVIWPAFQGMSLRTDTPYTAGILAAASSDTHFPAFNDELFTVVGRAVLQLDGELVYGADIRSIRRLLGSREMRLSGEENRTVFPGATAGNSMEDGNLFAICSVLGAYGMISHAFDVTALIGGNGNAAWDLDKKQIGLFESEILAPTPWLEGRTLSRTDADVRSYQGMDYDWILRGRQMELNCSGIARGQAFFYHTDARIAGAKGLTYQDVGNGYYLLRVQDNHGAITLEER